MKAVYMALGFGLLFLVWLMPPLVVLTLAIRESWWFLAGLLVTTLGSKLVWNYMVVKLSGEGYGRNGFDEQAQVSEQIIAVIRRGDEVITRVESGT